MASAFCVSILRDSGSSDGEFGRYPTSLPTSRHLVRAANYLRKQFAAPALLVGHSLGGAAVLAAASRVPEAKAVVTISAPSDVAHVLRHFHADLDEIERQGKGEVTLARTRQFTITSQFVKDAKGHALPTPNCRTAQSLACDARTHRSKSSASSRFATAIFHRRSIRRSFVSLDDADHLLLHRRDAAYVAEVIAAWASRYLPAEAEGWEAATNDIVASETKAQFLIVAIAVGSHRLLADEPASR